MNTSGLRGAASHCAVEGCVPRTRRSLLRLRAADAPRVKKVVTWQGFGQCGRISKNLASPRIHTISTELPEGRGFPEHRD